MANLALLKNLFSKLKPATKALVPYADDAARGLTTLGKTGGGVNLARNLALAASVPIAASKASAAAKTLAANNADDVARIAQHTGDPLGGFVETGPLGNTITHYMNVPGRVDIDGKAFHYPIRYSPQNALKERLLDKRTGLGKPDPGDFVDEVMTLGESFPRNLMVRSGDPTWRPHMNTALGRWFERNVPKDYKGFIDDFGDEYFIF